MSSNILTSALSPLIDDILFSQPVKISGGGYLSSCYITDQNQNYPIYIQTPVFLYNGIKTKQNHAIIDLEENTNTQEFFKLIEELENSALPKIVENSDKWFTNSLSLELLTEQFEKQIKFVNQKRKIQLKFPFKNNELILDVVNTKDEIVPISNMTNKKIMAICKYEGIKFLKNKSYLELTLLKVQLQKENLLDYIIPTQENIELNNNKFLEFSKLDDDIEDDKTVVYNLDQNNNDLNNSKINSNKIQISENEESKTNQLENDQIEINELEANNLQATEVEDNSVENKESKTTLMDNMELVNNHMNDGDNDDDDNTNLSNSEINLDNLLNLGEVDLERYESYDYQSDDTSGNNSLEAREINNDESSQTDINLENINNDKSNQDIIELSNNNNDNEIILDNQVTNNLENEVTNNLENEVTNNLEIDLTNNLENDLRKNKNNNNEDQILIERLESEIEILENDCKKSKDLYELSLSNLRRERLKLNKLKGKKNKGREIEI